MQPERQVRGQKPESEEQAAPEQESQCARQTLQAIHPGDICSRAVLLQHEPRKSRVGVSVDPRDDGLQQQFDDEVHGLATGRGFQRRCQRSLRPASTITRSRRLAAMGSHWQAGMLSVCADGAARPAPLILLTSAEGPFTTTTTIKVYATHVHRP